MYISENIAARIKTQAKNQSKTVGTIMSEAGLGVNTVYKISKGTDILTLNFAKIADALNCSVDYLLGRTDTPQLLPDGIEQAEMHVLNLYRQLNNEGMKKASDFMQDLIDTGKYKKYNTLEIELEA